MEAGSILVKRGLISSKQLDQLRLDRPDATRLDVAAVDLGLVTEEAALPRWATRLASHSSIWNNKRSTFRC